MSAAVLVDHLSAWWPRLTLARQFALISSAVLVVGMVVLGTWVSTKVAEAAKQNAAASAALYLDSLIAPHVQELASAEKLSSESRAALDQIMTIPALRSQIVALKVWRHDGVILYSEKSELLEAQFPVGALLKRAWAGEIAVDFEHEHSTDENQLERAGGVPLLEVYMPVRNERNGNVIAVAEFYKNAMGTTAELSRARQQSWIITGLVTLSMIAGVSLIVLRGSKTIEEQRIALTQRVAELSHLLGQNQELRRRLELAAHRAAEVTERHLRALGADLHDGPAQLISLALLRLDALRPGAVGFSAAGAERDVDIIQNALADGLKEVRDISMGLSLPEIDKLSVSDALRFMVREHERRTQTAVSSAIADIAAVVPHSVKLCLCRFVQEALNNAFRHAGGREQTVTAESIGSEIVVRVLDRGPGLPANGLGAGGPRLGLTGIWERIESLGGKLSITSGAGEGTRLTACLPLTGAGGVRWEAKSGWQ